jgi:hypothetical protein
MNHSLEQNHSMKIYVYLVVFVMLETQTLTKLSLTLMQNIVYF